MSPITQPEVEAIVHTWRTRAEGQGYKPGTATYAKLELEFFVGVIATLLALGRSFPPVWEILIRSGRSLSATLCPQQPSKSSTPRKD
jgi:hypothetical protein